jgi:choline kinase
MKAIILAAGRGSRMKGLTEDKPKCLVELHGRTLLDMQLDAIHQAGITDVGIVTGYRRELLASRGSIEFFNERWSQTNMVSSLACAGTWLAQGPCIVSYSDIFYDASAVRSLMGCDAPLAVTYDPNWLAIWSERFGDPLVDAETFRIDPDQCVVEIGNKPDSVEEVQGQYMGLLRFTPEGWQEVERIRSEMQPQLADKIHMTGTLQKVIERGRIRLRGIPYLGKWGEVDSEVDLQTYQKT